MNAKTLEHTLSVERASTVASISVCPQPTYEVEATYSFHINVAHSTSGETAPTSGKVTAQLGTGGCSETTGMESGLVETSSVEIGTTQTFTFNTTSHKGKTLRVCYRYDGDGSHYLASKYGSTGTFTVTAQRTSVTIGAQPDSVYQVGEKYSITVNATRSGGSGTVPADVVAIQIGTGACNAATGFASPISAWTSTVGIAREITFVYDHVKGQDVRFCVRYTGNDSVLDPSVWVASNALRVQAVPTWSAAANVEVVASENRTVMTDFSVILNNGYSPLQSHVQVVLNDEGSTLVCPSPTSDTEKTCSLKSAVTSTDGKTSTFTFQVASNTAKTWTVKPRYVPSLSATDMDANNVAATGSTFTITSRYSISLSAVSSSAGCSGCSSSVLWAYTPKELATGEVMSTGLNANLTVANFSNFNFETAGFSTAVSGENGGTTGIAVESSSSTCSITNTATSGNQVGAISCPQIRVTNSLIDSFRLNVTPTNSSSFTGTLNSATATGLTIVQNVIEKGSETAYDIKVSNGYCIGSDGRQQKYIIEGYAAGPYDPSNPLTSTDFVFRLRCEKDNDGDDDWDKTYYYTSANLEYPALTWDNTVTPNKFSFTITGNVGTDGYSGCESDADGIQFYLRLNDPANIGIFKGFEVFDWSTGETFLHDDKAGSDQAYDHCRDA